MWRVSATHGNIPIHTLRLSRRHRCKYTFRAARHERVQKYDARSRCHKHDHGFTITIKIVMDFVRWFADSTRIPAHVSSCSRWVNSKPTSSDGNGTCTNFCSKTIIPFLSGSTSYIYSLPERAQHKSIVPNNAPLPLKKGRFSQFLRARMELDGDVRYALE